MKSDKVYLQQIVDCIQKITAYIGEETYDNFLSDSKTQSAVIMQIALIGELAKKISIETKSKIDLPWKEISGFRDRIIHDYFQIDVEIVWNTIKENIPKMYLEVQKITKDM